jgi:hypothetical protein
VKQWQDNVDGPLKASKDDVQNSFYGILTQLMDQYNNPENFDSLASTEYKLSIAERKVANQIKQAMANTQDLEEADHKA